MKCAAFAATKTCREFARVAFVSNHHFETFAVKPGRLQTTFGFATSKCLHGVLVCYFISCSITLIHSLYDYLCMSSLVRAHRDSKAELCPALFGAMAAHCSSFPPRSACPRSPRSTLVGALPVEELELLNCIPAPTGMPVSVAALGAMRGVEDCQSWGFNLAAIKWIGEQQAGSQGPPLRRFIDLTPAITCEVHVFQPPATGTASAIAAMGGATTKQLWSWQMMLANVRDADWRDLFSDPNGNVVQFGLVWLRRPRDRTPVWDCFILHDDNTYMRFYLQQGPQCLKIAMRGRLLRAECLPLSPGGTPCPANMEELPPVEVTVARPPTWLSALDQLSQWPVPAFEAPGWSEYLDITSGRWWFYEGPLGRWWWLPNEMQVPQVYYTEQEFDSEFNVIGQTVDASTIATPAAWTEEE